VSRDIVLILGSGVVGNVDVAGRDHGSHRRGPVVGEGYDQAAAVADAVQKVYGRTGRSTLTRSSAVSVFVGGRQEPAVRHVVNFGADGLFI
jgi:hypothetical protein